MHIVTRSSRQLTAFFLAVGMASCASGGAPSWPAVAGQFEGAITLQGQSIQGTMVIEQEGEDLRAVFDAPDLGLVAEGDGTISRSRDVELSLDYDLQCPGVAGFAGQLSENGREFSGRLSAQDCTGVIVGTFAFRR